MAIYQSLIALVAITLIVNQVEKLTGLPTPKMHAGEHKTHTGVRFLIILLYTLDIKYYGY